MTTRGLKILLLLLIATTLIVSVRAAVPFENDSSHTVVKSFSQSEINQYKKQRAFIYTNDAPAENSFMAMFWYKVNRFLHRLFNARVGTINIYTIILYVCMILGMVLLIFHFFKISPQSLLQRSSAPISVEIGDGENIHEIDFDRLIEQSAMQQNYRLAVRFWYLKMLKIMSDAQLIHWQINKTNYDYYYELKLQSTRDSFLNLTDTFENSWYGAKELTADRYQEASNSFQSFFTHLSGR